MSPSLLFSTLAASPEMTHKNFTKKKKKERGLQVGSSSYSQRGVLLVPGDAGPASVGRRAGGLEGSVSPLSGVQVGLGRVGVADVLRVEKLSLVRHDLRGLLAVEHGEVGGHVDEDAGVGGQAAGGLSPHEGGAGGGGRGGGAGRRGRAGLA